MTHLLGGSVVLEESFTPESFVDAVTRHKVTTTALVPTMLGRLVGLAPERLASMPRTLRAVFVGGAPLSPRLALDAMDALGDVLFQFYGATETGLVTLATPTDLRERPASIGRALPGVEVRLLDEAGAPVALGDVGELFAASASLIEGYAGDPNATAASLREGAFSVGDLAYADDEGRYFLVGRKRDLIISGGVNVYPAEVEAVLEAHPDVAEAAVVGAPDADLGERVVAFVVLREGVTPGNDHLEAHARRELAGPKRPRAYHWVTELPRNPTGKVLKTELRRRVQGAPGAT
jgi:fatty-acyl-CoA synthase